MGENPAEEEDDESFGDFKYVPYQNQTVHSNQINRVDDDDWGDFIIYSNQVNGVFEFSNGHSSSPFTSKPSETSKPFDLLDVSVDHTGKHCLRETELSGVELKSSPNGSDKAHWVNPRGALPLTIFGEEEDVEEDSDANEPAFAQGTYFFSNKNGDSVGKGSSSNGAVGINDLIANLYNQFPRIKNEDISNSNLFGANTNSNSNSSILDVSYANQETKGVNFDPDTLDSDQVDGEEDGGDDDGGWEFKSAGSEIPVENGISEVRWK